MLIGRDRELEQVTEALEHDGLVVIVGPAGIGKSTLARAALAPQGGFREAGALASLAWSPSFVFRRLLRRDPPENPEDLAGAVLRSGTGPVMLDDLQWADDASLQAVALLAARVPMVVTVRTGEPRSGFVADALACVGAQRIDLAGLAPSEARSLVERLHPTLSPNDADRLLDAADGSPLLLRELPGSTMRSPVLVTALADRLRSLTDDGRRAGHRLAVLGRPAQDSILGPGAVELERAGLATTREGWFIIRHALLGEVIVEGLGARADAIRHALVDLVDGAEGAHLLLAAGDPAAARSRALAAVDGADRRTQAVLLRLAADCAPDLDPGNRMRAARLFTATSQPDEARRVCSVPGVDDLPPVERGALRAAEAEAAWLQGRHEECIELLGSAIVDLRGSRTGAEVLVLAGSTIAQTWVGLDGRPALERAREAVRLADEIGQEQGYARSRLASVLLTAGEPGWGQLLREVIHQADLDGDDDLRRTAVTSLILAQWVSGDPAAAEVTARAEVVRGPRQEPDAGWLTALAYAAITAVVCGRPRRPLIEELEPILREEPVFRSRPFLEGALVMALADDGRPVEAERLAERAAQRAGSEPQWQAMAAWTLAEAAWAAGRDEQAAAAAERVLGLGAGDHPSAVQARLIGAHAARLLGRPMVGPAPAALLPAWRGAPIEWAALEAAADGRSEDAIAALGAAAEAWATADVRSAGRCRWAAADLATTAGSPEADALLAAAADHAATYGLGSLAGRIRRSARHAGQGSQGGRARAATGLGGLTRREEEVLDLVAAGLASTDIAAALGIGVATVDSFLRSARRKLGAPTRLAAAMRLAELRSAVSEGPERSARRTPTP